MIEATVNGAEAPPASEPAKSTTDQMIDDALSFLSETDPKAERPPKTPKAPDDEPSSEPDAAPDAEPGEVEVEPEPETDEEPETDSTHGSKEDPFTIKDLPEDRYIEIKVDGEKAVVSLSELASGYIREKTFSARINKTKQLADQAQAALGKAKEVQERVRTEFQTFIRDPEQVFEFFLQSEDREQVLEAVAQRYALMLRRFREAPHERLQYQRQRDVRRLEWERQQFEAQKQRELEARQQQELAQRAQSIFRPGWEDGLRRAGFPQPTKELWEEVLVRVKQRADSGHQITSEDVSEFVVRAVKLLELPPKGKRPTPAPKVAASPRARPASANGRDWASVPAHERRRDPDYFLRNLKPRDFR